MNINQIGTDNYRSLFGYVPQDPFLFNESIKNNILLPSQKFLKNKELREIVFAQKKV